MQRLGVVWVMMIVFPNPFNNDLNIKINVQSDVELSLEIFDLQGMKLISLINSNLEKGNHVIHWDGKTAWGAEAPAGVYLCKFGMGEDHIFKRIVKQ